MALAIVFTTAALGEGHVRGGRWRDRDGTEIVSYRNGLIKSKTYQGGRSFRYEYDPSGNLTAAIDSMTGPLRFEYDAEGELKKITYPNGAFYKYTYDAVGHLNTRTDQDGFTLKYTYDPVGAISSVADSKGLIVSYRYDRSRLVQERFGNGASCDYTYQGPLVESITNRGPDGVTQSSFNYQWSAGTRVEHQETHEGTYKYVYDVGSQLTQVTYPSGKIETFEYAPGGLRKKRTFDGASTEYSPGRATEYSAAGSTRFQYENGNLTKMEGPTSSRIFTYDRSGRLATTTSSNQRSVFVYNALGFLAISDIDGKKCDYVTDPTTSTQDADMYYKGNLVRHRIFGRGLVCTQMDGDSFYFGYDACGTAWSVSNSGGKRVELLSYSPFGERMDGGKPALGGTGFLGRFGFYESPAGFVLVEGRAYLPQFGLVAALLSESSSHVYSGNCPTPLPEEANGVDDVFGFESDQRGLGTRLAAMVQPTEPGAGDDGG